MSILQIIFLFQAFTYNDAPLNNEKYEIAIKETSKVLWKTSDYKEHVEDYGKRVYDNHINEEIQDILEKIFPLAQILVERQVKYEFTF